MAVREWRQFGRIAAVSQLFSVLLFPLLFSTLRCAFRSDSLLCRIALLVAPWTSTPHRRRARASIASTIRQTFRYYRFSVRERKRPSRREAGKSILLFLGSVPNSVSSYGRVTALAVLFRSTFFRIFDCCIIYAGAVITAPDRRRLPKRSHVPSRDDAVLDPSLSYSIYLTSLAGTTFSCNVQ